MAGRNVMITGATGNLGRALADYFLGQGDSLTVIGSNTASLSKAYGGKHTQIAADLTDAKSTLAALSKAGRVDVLCNIAGGFQMGPKVHETTPELWRQMQDLNATTIVNTARAVVPGMIEAKSGAIVNVAAFSALSGKAAMGAYVASKSAVIRLTETMAAELKEDGVNVNCVLPGVIDTPENRKAMPNADTSRWVQPAALAAIIGFLASDAAKPIHGAALPVTGLG